MSDISKGVANTL